MATLERPKLRPLPARKFDRDGQSYALIHDPAGAFYHPVLVPLDTFLCVCRHFDGRLTLAEIQSRVQKETGQPLLDEILHRLIAQLDEAMVLDGPTFASFRESFRRSGSRPAALAGHSYPAHARALRAQLDGFYLGEGGSGVPRPVDAGPGPVPHVRAVLSPHIDLQRGGPVYTWAYKELAEERGVDTFVILGVAHQPCRGRFVLTLKDFETPLGIVPTNRDYVREIARNAGEELFDEELVHRTEHSIEFQAVFLRHVMGDRPFSIVPILVGSFEDYLDRGMDPINDPEILRFVDALRNTEVASGGRVIYIGGIDLCHVGPEFGDPDPVDVSLQDRVSRFDRDMLNRAAAVDAAGWFRTAVEVSNRWRVCGLAATYTLLHTIGPARGRLLKYHQAIDDRRTCCVSFASMVFHSPGP